MIRRLLLPLLLAAAPVFAAPAPENAPTIPRTLRGSPTSAIRRAVDAYEHRSLDELASALAADYRFHFSEGDSCGLAYVNGIDRDRELENAGVMFGNVRSAKTSIRDFESGPDPEHPDSVEHYRVVIAHRFQFRFTLASAPKDVMLNDAADHIFYLVRGDAAQLVPGQPPSREIWYIRRWFENAHKADSALAKMSGQCEEAVAQSIAPLPVVLGVRAVNSPLCPTLTLLCDLPTAEPSKLEVFDVAGRRMSQRELVPGAAGTTMRVEAGSGTRFAPGAYFVRLSQGRAKPVSKMVLVAK